MARFRLEWMSLVYLLTGTLVKLTVFYETTDALECHCTSGCDSNFQCIGSSNCTRGWSGPTCQRYNLALGKGTEQSSTVNDCRWANNATKRAACGLKNSSLAVDGIRSTRYWSGTCTHTDVNQTEAWWKMDLGLIHQIYHIKIYSPVTDKERLDGFKVTVDGKPCYTRSPGDSLDPPLSIHCIAPVNGSNVLMRAFQEKFILNLCEVEVYECADSVFGEQCSSRCNCKSPDEVCDKVTGHCPSECADGYTGEGCQTYCVDGKFGASCSSSCTCKNPDEICNKVTGHCSSGCSDGYTGQGCQTRCPRGKYGLRCSETCGNCAGGYRQCNHVDGRCKKRCKGNWDGDQCKVCKDFWFGEQCSTECSCKDPYEVCNKATGECERSGCQDGQTGVNCQTPCIDGTYGYQCTKQCGNCLLGGVCGKIEGECPSGCVDGFFSPNCQVCNDYRFGPDCTKKCNCRNSTEVCDKPTGLCVSSGCRDGWTGRDCLTPCKDGSYGHDCTGTCGQCLQKHVCEKQGGACQAGCKEGFLEPLCQECRAGHYGPECRRCGQCLDNSPCDKQTGRCAEGCQPGWKGDNCHEANVARSGTIKVFDFVESKSPTSIHGNLALTRDGNTSLAACVTVTGRQPSWKITLDNKNTVYGVGIYMHINDNSSQISVVVVGSFCYHGLLLEEKEEQDFKACHVPTVGRSVTIYLQNTKKEINLTLCEVKVYVNAENTESTTQVIPITLTAMGVTILLLFGVVIVLLIRRRSQVTKTSSEDRHGAIYVNDTNQLGDSSNEQLEDSEGHNYEVLQIECHIHEDTIRSNQMFGSWFVLPWCCNMFNIFDVRFLHTKQKQCKRSVSKCNSSPTSTD